MKGSREIGLRRKAQCDSNIEQRLIPSCQKLFRALKTTRAHVLMRRLAHSGFECSRKVEPAQRSDFRKRGDHKILFAQATSRGSTRMGGDHSFKEIQLPRIGATGAGADQYPQLKNRTQHFLLKPPIDSSLS